MKLSFLSLAVLVLLATPNLRAQAIAEPPAAPPPAAADMPPVEPVPAPLAPAPMPVAPLPRQPIITTNSLLKVNVTYQAFNVQIPWQKDSPGARRGLGVVLEDRRVLVTAQMVADASYIELEQPESGQKLTAKVIAVDYEANVALLAPDTPAREDAFFASLKPMEIDTSVRIGDSLSVWQIGPVGDLIVTPLRVAKVETARYFVDGSVFLVYEGTGIVRSEGNSFTLPVVKNGKLAGLLLRYDTRNQVTTVLPAPIIEHFLKDTADGEYEGFPNLGVEFQLTLDEQFRDYLGMKPGDPGMYVSQVSPGGTGEALGLKEGDILTSVNGFSIDSRGNYRDPQFGTLSISHIVRGRAYVGDPVQVSIIRNGKKETLDGNLLRKLPSEYLVSPYRFDRGPNYLLAGGLLFQELSHTYLDAFGKDRRSGAVLRLDWIAKHPEEFEESGLNKVIFISAVLPTASCQGYERLGGHVVEKVNGEKIIDLASLDAALKKPQDGVHTIELREFPHLIHIDALAMERDNMAIMSGGFRVGSLKRIE